MTPEEIINEIWQTRGNLFHLVESIRKKKATKEDIETSMQSLDKLKSKLEFYKKSCQ